MGMKICYKKSQRPFGEVSAVSQKSTLPVTYSSMCVIMWAVRSGPIMVKGYEATFKGQSKLFSNPKLFRNIYL